MTDFENKVNYDDSITRFLFVIRVRLEILRYNDSVKRCIDRNF